MKQKLFRAGCGSHAVEATAVLCGGDLSLALGGGEKPHIGAIAIAVPRPSLTGDGARSSSASVHCLPGHKEDLLARGVALDLAKQLGRTVVVTAGLHIDGASAQDIAQLEKNARTLLVQISAWLDAPDAP